MTDAEQAELDKVIAILHAAIPELERLHASHDRLLAAAKDLMASMEGRDLLELALVLRVFYATPSPPPRS